MKNHFFKGLLLSIVFVSCSTNDDKDDLPVPTTPISKLQNKWSFQSVFVYADAGLTMPTIYGTFGTPGEYFDFRTDGKLYAHVVGSYDTAKYVMTSDTTMISNQYYGGVLSAHTDTMHIRLLTLDSMVFAVRNPAGEYGAFRFSR